VLLYIWHRAPQHFWAYWSLQIS